MAGEDFFKFNKGNEFRFSNFREIKEEDLKGADEKTKKLFNIFAGEDKILQEVEAKSLFNVLKSAAGDNQVLEDNEIKAFAKEHIGEDVDTNILATFVNNIFGVKEKPQNQAVQNILANAPQKQQTFLEEAACKEIVIDIIDENLSEAYEILNSQYLGSISGWHDERKDKNDILKTSNVSKVLDYQSAGIEWMNKAKLAPPNGLTKKEYYEGNKQRIKDMILTRVLVLDTNTKFKELKNKYSEEKLAQIIGDYVEQLCSNASMEDLKDIQKQFVSYSGVEEIQALENVVDNAIKFNADKNKPVPYSEVPLPKFDNSKGIVPEYWNTDEPISFEEVYKIERGTEYSQYKIEQYALAKKEMEVVANAYNKKQQFVEFAEGLRKDETLNIDEKTQKVLEGFATFYALAEDGGLSQLQELIAESKLPISIDENGFNFGTLDDSAKNRALNSLLKLAQQSKEKEFEEFLNGKTIEDYQIALAQAHDEAIGDENGKMMAEAMKNDNLTCIQRWTVNTSMAGMGMTIVGGILCFTPLAPLGAGMITVGNTLAIGGMVAETGLGVADYATKDVQTTEEAEQLGKNFLMNAGGFIIGIGAGKAGMKAFSNLIDEKLVAVFGKQIAAGNKMQALKTVFTNPEYLKNFMTAAGAKLSADFVISYAGDLAMMGILDTQDDWQSLLKANLTGILVGMSGDIKDVSGVGRPRNFGVSDGVRPMTEMDYGQRLLGNDVTVADPKTGATVEGTVTGLYSQNGQVEIEVNGQRYSTNDVAEVKGEAKVEVETPKVEISLGQRLETASSREDFVAIRDEIKAMPKGAEKTALQQEYLRKWNEFSRKYNEQFDIRMEYKPELENVDHKESVLKVLKELGANEKQLAEFQLNASDDVITFIQSRISAPDFNPLSENYFIHLKTFNLSLVQELIADASFPKEQISLVASAAFTPHFTKQIENAYKKGIDIIPGCKRVLQIKAEQEARMSDPAVIASRKAYETAQSRIMENTTLSKQDISDLAEWGNIREVSIQDLIIYLENKNIKNYYNLLRSCSENSEGSKFETEIITQRVELIIKGLECGLSEDDIDYIMHNYRNSDIKVLERAFDSEIKRVINEKIAIREKEAFVADKKNEILNKYGNSETKEILTRILNKENVSEEYIKGLQKLLNVNSSKKTCIFFEKYVENNTDFEISVIRNEYDKWLKTADLETNTITDSWKILLEKTENVDITEKYLQGLLREDGRPLFNDLSIKTILEFYKQNPKMAKVIIEKCKQNCNIAAPAVIEPLAKLVEIDPDLAFSIIDMKNNDGTKRFDLLDLSFIFEPAINTPESVRKAFHLEQILNEEFNNLSSYLLDPENIDSINSLNSLIGISDISELTKIEKKNLLAYLLMNKGNYDVKYQKISECYPKNDEEYSKLINNITQNLSISSKPLNYNEQNMFNESLQNLITTIKTMDLDNLSILELSISHKNFISEIETTMQNLPKSEQRKICSYFGFQIESGKLTGYPNLIGKDISVTSITDKNSIETLNNVKPIIDNYVNNNFIIVKNNSALSNVLKNITKFMPELFNQVNGTKSPTETLKALQTIVCNPKFDKLNTSDKKIMVLSTLLHKTDNFSNSAGESAFDAYFISKRFNLSNEETQKVYRIVESSDLIEKFMSTNKKETFKVYRGIVLEGNERQNIFDLLSFNLKEGNIMEMAQMLYSTKEQDGLTRYLDKALSNRIKEMKTADFTLPQTSKDEYFRHAENKEIYMNGKKYVVSVVNSSDINDFYAFIHTPEAGYATGGTRQANFANFEIFKNFADDKVICTSYITKDKASLVKEFHHGFIFEIANDKQFVGYGTDIGSLSKNIPDMLIEYYRIKSNSKYSDSDLWEAKYKQRTTISNNLKSKLYGVNYLSPDIDPIKKKLIDDDYIRRLDNIKQQLGNKIMTFENLELIDPEFASAYKEFFNFDEVRRQNYDEFLLNSFHHNEVIVSNPNISAIFTDALHNIPEEYLIKAQEENLPIVIINN